MGDSLLMLPSHLQLPALERLDLRLTLAGDMPDPEMAGVLGRLEALQGLSSFALQAGPMKGLLRNLRPPPGIKVSNIIAQGYIPCS